MKMKVLGSGSDGNCIILTDDTGHQIMLDCGLKSNIIVPNVEFNMLDCILITHAHQDHLKGADYFKKFYVDMVTWENVVDGKQVTKGNWQILPMRLVHNAECFGFLIYNKIEKKKILYVTDTTFIPNLSTKLLDLCIIECNYDEDVFYAFAEQDRLTNNGCLNHLSKQQLLEYFEMHPDLKIKNLVLSHLSRSGLVNFKTLASEFSQFADNVLIALKGTELAV